MPTPLTLALAAHFDSVFAGPNGDYPAVLEALEGVSAGQALWKPTAGVNSIWQIVDHLTASKDWQIEILKKGHAPSPTWTQPEGGESAWQASLAWLKDAHARLKEALLRLGGRRLYSHPEPGWNMTQLELLLSIAAHEAFHAGQIDYLKGLQEVVSARPARERDEADRP